MHVLSWMPRTLWNERVYRRGCAEDRGKATVGFGSRIMKHELMLEEHGTIAFKGLAVRTS